MNPLLSIVIPTKNRYPYLLKLIELLASTNSNEVEIVIQDNNEDNTPIVNYFKTQHKISFDNLRYFHIKESIPVNENSDKGISNSSGEYVCLIGDDDGLLINSIIEVVKKMKNLEIEAAIFPSIIYNWPDFVDNSIYKLKGVLLLPYISGSIIKLSPKKELDKVIKNSFSNLGKMPRTYQGIVKRSVLDKVKLKTGIYFPGASPDMANSIALSLLVKNCYYFDRPLIISGQSRTLGGGERLNKGVLKKPNEVGHLPKNIEYDWDYKIPFYWCAETIWPISALSSLKTMGVQNIKVNYDAILSQFLYKHNMYFFENIKLANRKLKVLFKILKLFIQDLFVSFTSKLSHIISKNNRITSKEIIRNLYSIEDAINYLCEKDRNK